jgi:hypothetical protein
MDTIGLGGGVARLRIEEVVDTEEVVVDTEEVVVDTEEVAKN